MGNINASDLAPFYKFVPMIGKVSLKPEMIDRWRNQIILYLKNQTQIYTKILIVTQVDSNRRSPPIYSILNQLLILKPIDSITIAIENDPIRICHTAWLSL